MTVLTEELLARAERLYLMALAKRTGLLGVYHGEGGVPAESEAEFSPKETKWLT